MPFPEPPLAGASRGPSCTDHCRAQQVLFLSPQTSEQKEWSFQTLLEQDGTVRRQMELLLSVITGCPEHLYK